MTRTPRLLGGRYEVGDLLGHGGMAEVHRGRDLRLGRTIAIKILRRDLAGDEDFRERFRREAQHASRLVHATIVAIHDTGEDRARNGARVPYIIMELVNGPTLREVLAAEGRLPQRRALELVADICVALEVSHQHGVIHRDVKPGNVMLTPDGRVKVLDFGISCDQRHQDLNSTLENPVIGTAQYLSPEQARGEPVDGRSDLYATGCVLFELLIGQPPFVGDTPLMVAYQHVRSHPPVPSTMNREIARDVDAIVLKALSKAPPNRYQSAGAMRADVLRAIGHTPVPQHRPRRLFARSRPDVDATPVLPLIAYVPETPIHEFDGSTTRELDSRLEMVKRRIDVAQRRRDLAQVTSLREQESAIITELLRRFRSGVVPPGQPDRGGRLPDRARSAAILVGTSRYADPGLPDLPAVTNNLRDLGALLAHRRHGGFDLARLHVAENPGRDVGGWIAEKAENIEDTLLVYFCGHGLIGSDGELYLGLPGTSSRRSVYSALPYPELRQAIKESPARNKVLILDCCYSGKAIGTLSADDLHSGIIDVAGAYVITSTSGTKPARADVGARHSAFTGELIALLTQGDAGLGSLLRLTDVYGSLLRRLKAAGRPEPQQRGVDTTPDLALARNPAWRS